MGNYIQTVDPLKLGVKETPTITTVYDTKENYAVILGLCVTMHSKFLQDSPLCWSLMLFACLQPSWELNRWLVIENCAAAIL